MVDILKIIDLDVVDGEGTSIHRHIAKLQMLHVIADIGIKNLPLAITDGFGADQDRIG